MVHTERGGIWMGIGISIGVWMTIGKVRREWTKQSLEREAEEEAQNDVAAQPLGIASNELAKMRRCVRHSRHHVAVQHHPCLVLDLFYCATWSFSSPFTLSLILDPYSHQSQTLFSDSPLFIGTDALLGCLVIVLFGFGLCHFTFLLFKFI